MSEITVKRCVRTGGVPSRLGPMVLHHRTKMRYHSFGQQLQLKAESNYCIIILMHLHHHLRSIYLTRFIPRRLALQNVHRIRINEGRLHTVRLTKRKELRSGDSNNLGTRALHWQNRCLCGASQIQVGPISRCEALHEATRECVSISSTLSKEIAERDRIEGRWGTAGIASCTLEKDKQAESMGVY